jgi:hypothetical protein
MRAIRARYDPYEQAKGRVEQLKSLGHSVEKVRLFSVSLTRPYVVHEADSSVLQLQVEIMFVPSVSSSSPTSIGSLTHPRLPSQHHGRDIHVHA